MARLGEIRRRLVMLVRGRRFARDLDEEIRLHQALRAARHVDRGASPAEAAAAARRSFGGPLHTREESRDAWGWTWLEQAIQDARHGLRLLLRQPGFSLTTVLTLALGVGATTAIWTIVHGVLLRPAPIENLDRLVVVWEADRNSGTSREPASIPDFLDFSSRSRTLDGLAALWAGQATATPPGGEPEYVARLFVTPELAAIAGIRPIVGRPFGSAGADDRETALVSEALWRRLYGGVPDITGQPLVLDDRVVTIVGVLPDEADFGVLQTLSAAAYGNGFAARGEATRVDVWSPLLPEFAALPRSTHPVLLVGRLAPGNTIAQAQAELGAIAADLEAAYPENLGRGVHVEAFSTVVFGPVQPAFYAVSIAVAILFLVACVNVAALLLARTTARSDELAVRRALGAPRGRLVRQFLVESLLVTLIAGVLGIALAYFPVRAFALMAPALVPRASLVSIDATVLVSALGILVVVGVIFGLAPALPLRRGEPAPSAASGQRGAVGPSGSRVRQTLVAAELALAVALLASAGLLVRSLWNLQHVDTGFRSEGVLKAEYRLPASRYPVDMSRWPQFDEQHAFTAAVLESAGAIPGVVSAAVAGNHPMDRGFTNSFRIVGRESEGAGQPELWIRRVSPAYFETVGLPIVSGRPFDERDGTREPAVALLNHSAARRFFADRPAEGEQIAFWGVPRTVVGVVADERFTGVRAEEPLAVYVPAAQAPSNDGSGVLLVRTDSGSLTIAADVRRAIAAVDPSVAVFGIEPLTRTVSRTLAEPRLTATAVATFAAAALLLGGVGVYGMLSFEVARRRRELGVRVALGARPAGIVRHVVGQGLRPALAGLAVGVAAALAGGRVFASLLFGVSPHDPVTLAATGFLLLGVALAAMAVPALRAARVDPVQTLR